MGRHPGTPAHETGNAVDLVPDATAWLSRHGVKYRLCQIYSNEPWHCELRPDAVYHGCPPPYADPTQDPKTPVAVAFAWYPSRIRGARSDRPCAWRDA